VLAGSHSGIDGRRGVAAEALHDWSSGLSGIKVGPFRDIAAVYINEKNRLREQQEQKRVLYVAMTRAREHLIVSSGPSARRESGSFVCMLDSALDGEIGRAEESAVLEIDRGQMLLEIVESSLAAPGLSKTKNKTAERKRNWRPYIDSWRDRREAYSAALKVPLFLTPTLLKRQEQESSEAAEPPRGQMHTRSPAMLVGELAHRFLEHWDFRAGKEVFGGQFQSFTGKWLAPDSQKQSARVRVELETILRRFIDSPVHAELAQARVLGRVVPLLVPWDRQVMEGVIDLIYEKNGLLYLADYKTDAIERRDLRAGAQRYRRQAEIYTQAARQSLKREVAAFKLIFLRLGEAIEVDVNPDKELWLFEISP
jgi:ATP-dependent helicase/nuclease subunit A